MVCDSSSSPKKQVTQVKEILNPKGDIIAMLVQSYRNFAEVAYLVGWVSLLKELLWEGSVPAALAAGLFLMFLKDFMTITTVSRLIINVPDFSLSGLSRSFPEWLELFVLFGNFSGKFQIFLGTFKIFKKLTFFLEISNELHNVSMQLEIFQAVWNVFRLSI